MWYLKNELLSNGFDGPNFTKSKNGYLYTFDKNMEGVIFYDSFC